MRRSAIAARNDKEAKKATTRRRPAAGEQADRGDSPASDEASLQRFDSRFQVRHALAERGLELATLAPDELHLLEQCVWERLSPILAKLADQWKTDPRRRAEQERVDRELRRLFIAQRDQQVSENAPCEGCGYPNHHPDWSLREFHGLRICDECSSLAEYLLATLQRPQIEALQAEPTLENARALGFKLCRRTDGRLAWHDQDGDDVYDGDGNPYADEHAALQDLADELTNNLAWSEQL